MTDKEIVERAKEAEKRTGFGELVHSPISKGVNSAYGIGFIEGMVEYRNSLQEEPVSEDLENEIQRYYVDWDEHPQYVQTARHFANWQKEQILKEVKKKLLNMLQTSVDNQHFFEQLDEYIDELENKQ